ncbi:MAG: nicotinate-nucleotide--dimethylbenzimidazole phosphoribosyltransferase, partial [Zetaproteobacteria bacterium]
VTAEMVRNFARGGAAINVLARKIGAELAVVDVGVAADLEALANVRRMKVRHGAGNICREPAMTPQECARAMDVGKALAREAEERGANLLIAGEMGIGNTTPSACLIAWATGAPPDAIVGRGTGVDETGLARKREAVRRALRRAQPSSPLEALAQLGGLEIAAIVGFYMEAARIGVPVLLDGFISAAAALIAEAIQPGTKQWMLASHRSAEQGHARALAALGLAPLFDLGMRLGEGTGAALAVPIVQAAVALHNEMATFAEAGVHGRSDAP